MKRVDWTDMGTATTKYPYTEEGIKIVKDAYKKLVRAIRRQVGQFYYTAIVVPANGKCHIHFAYQGPQLKVKALRKLWKKLTGCHQFKIIPWTKAHLYYLIFKNLALAPLCEGYSFRRIFATERMYPDYRRRKSPENPWMDINLQDIEELRAFMAMSDPSKLKQLLKKFDDAKFLPPWVVPSPYRTDRLIFALLKHPLLNRPLDNKNGSFLPRIAKEPKTSKQNMTLAPGLRAVDGISSNGADHGPPTTIRPIADRTETPSQSTNCRTLSGCQSNNCLPLDFKTRNSLRKVAKQGGKDRHPGSRQTYRPIKGEDL